MSSYTLKGNVCTQSLTCTCRSRHLKSHPQPPFDWRTSAGNMNMSVSCGSLQRSSNIKAGTLFFINYTSPNVKENMPLISTLSVSILKPLLHRHFTVLRKRNVGSGSPITSYQTFLVQIADRAQDESEKPQGAELLLCSCFGVFHRGKLIPVGGCIFRRGF